MIDDTGAEAVPTHRGRTLTFETASLEVLWPPLRSVPAAEDEELRNEDSWWCGSNRKG